MNLIEALNERSDEILAGAAYLVERSHLQHYQAAGTDRLWQRLEALYEVLVSCLRNNNGVPMIEYAEQMARDRFQAGYDVAEVQTAFSALEQAAWQAVEEGLLPGETSRALARVSSVLAMGRDVMARTYVSLASRSRTRVLDFDELRSA